MACICNHESRLCFMFFKPPTSCRPLQIYLPYVLTISLANFSTYSALNLHISMYLFFKITTNYTTKGKFEDRILQLFEKNSNYEGRIRTPINEIFDRFPGPIFQTIDKHGSAERGDRLILRVMRDQAITGFGR